MVRTVVRTVPVSSRSTYVLTRVAKRTNGGRVSRGRLPQFQLFTVQGFLSIFWLVIQYFCRLVLLLDESILNSTADFYSYAEGFLGI